MTAMLAVMVAGCGGSFARVRSAFYDQRPEEALTLLDQQEPTGDRDRLLYLMARGTILRQLARFPESTQAFLAAADLIDRQDIIRVTRQAAALVTNEWVTQYKGEYAERLWVHTYLMMNFLLMDRPESALVEARRALKVYGAYEAPLAGDLFSRALIALCFDMLGESNDAYIEYKRVANGLGTAAPVARDLERLANLLWEPDQAERYREAIPEPMAQWASEGSASELVVFVSWGHGPVKVARNFIIPPGIRFSFPAYARSPGADGSVTVTVNDTPVPIAEVPMDVGRVAAASLDARRVQVIAKETARVAAKEAVVQRLERDKDTALAGALLRAAFAAMEEADTRCWETLPAVLRLIRVPLPVGQNQVAISVTNGSGTHRIDLGLIESTQRSHIFRAVRLLN